MKFIFPKNYKFKGKIFGFFDYVTVIVDISIGAILFLIVHFVLKISVEAQVYVFISLFLPVLLFSILGTNGENIIQFSYYIIKFYKNRKIYFYEKTEPILKKEDSNNTNKIKRISKKLQTH